MSLEEISLGETSRKEMSQRETSQKETSRREIHWERQGYVGRRLFFLCAGFAIMALGVSFSIKASLGTSPVSSAPYVTSCIFGVSVGTTTIYINSLLVVVQILILRRQYQWFQLFQIPAAVFFGILIDATTVLLRPLPCTNYLEQWVLCIIGILLVGLGVSFEVAARLVTMPGEGVVLAICKILPVKFGNMKVLFDMFLVAVSILLSLLFLGELAGVREGTVAAAVFVGLVAKRCSGPTKKWIDKG